MNNFPENLLEYPGNSVMDSVALNREIFQLKAVLEPVGKPTVIIKSVAAQTTLKYDDDLEFAI